MHTQMGLNRTFLLYHIQLVDYQHVLQTLIVQVLQALPIMAQTHNGLQ